MACALTPPNVSLGPESFVRRRNLTVASLDMPVQDIQNMLSRLNTNGKTLYITQEVVNGAPAPDRPNDYTSTGASSSAQMRFMLADLAISRRCPRVGFSSFIFVFR